MSLCSYCATENQPEAATCHNCGASLRAPHLPIGTVLHDQYRIEQVLGQGGFGITYRAFDTMLEHHVAIKELFVQGSSRAGNNVQAPYQLTPSDYQRTKDLFLEEARVAQRFTHRNICRVYGVFEQHHTAYMVMEAMQGETLAARINRQERLTEARTRVMIDQLGAALQAIHEAGILHRDIKPENIFITNDERIVLLDFGSARAFVRGRATKHTKLVTPGYAAPEQYSSEAKFGEYTDVYGLAATAYHAIEGRMPPTVPDRLLGQSIEFEIADEIWRHALQKGLELHIANRTLTVKEFIQTTQRRLFEQIASSSDELSGISLPLANQGAAGAPAQIGIIPSSPVFYPVAGWKVTDQALYHMNTEFPFQDLREVELYKVYNGWESIASRSFNVWFGAFVCAAAILSIVSYSLKLSSILVLLGSLAIPTGLTHLLILLGKIETHNWCLGFHNHKSRSWSLDLGPYNLSLEEVVDLAETIANAKSVPLIRR
jgi:serine/threonine protein kinase